MPFDYFDISFGLLLAVNLSAQWLKQCNEAQQSSTESSLQRLIQNNIHTRLLPDP